MLRAAVARRLYSTYPVSSHTVSVAQILDGRARAFEHVFMGAPVLTAVERMALQGVGSLVVLNNEHNRVMEGIVTERDVLVSIPRLLERDLPLRVEHIMTRNPITVQASATVGECMSIMTQNFFRHLPVTDGNDVVGVVSIRDLVKQVAEDHRSEVSGLNAQLHKLAAILGEDLAGKHPTTTADGIGARWRSLITPQKSRAHS